MKNLSLDSFSILSIALVLTVPGLAIGAFGNLSLGIFVAALLTAFAILGASVVLALSLYRIGAMPRVAALLMVAFVVILPEFTWDTYHAWMGAAPLSSDFGSISLSAVTGSSAFLLGAGLPLLYLVNRLRTGNSKLEFHSSQGIDLLILLMVVFYGFVVYVKGYLWPLDTPVLLLLFGILAWKGFHRYRSTQVSLRAFQRSMKPALSAAPIVSNRMPMLVLYATVVIYLAMPAFADNVHALGLAIGSGGFTFMQDVIALLTKMPLLVVVAVMVWNGKVVLATSMLLMGVVGLWTLVLGTLPFAPLIVGALNGSPDVLTLLGNQRMEVLVAISQALLAVVLLSRLSLSGKGAATLMALLVLQRVLMYVHPQGSSALAQGIMIGLYAGLAALIVAWDRSRIWVLVGSVVGAGRPQATYGSEEGIPGTGATPYLGHLPPSSTSD